MFNSQCICSSGKLICDGKSGCIRSEVDSSIKQFKGFKLKKIFRDPNRIINIGVIKSEIEWQEVFHDKDLNCSIKKDWFDEDYEYIFKSQEELDMYISAYNEINHNKLVQYGFEMAKKQAIDTIEQYPGRVGVNSFKNELRDVLRKKYHEWTKGRVNKEKLKRIHCLINNIRATKDPSRGSLIKCLNDIVNIIAEVPYTESLDDNK